jgi:hypothetical protein
VDIGTLTSTDVYHECGDIETLTGVDVYHRFIDIEILKGEGDITGLLTKKP